MKKQDEIDEQLAAKKQEDILMRILAKELEIANLEKKARGIKNMPTKK